VETPSFHTSSQRAASLTKGTELTFYILQLLVRDKQYKIIGIEVLEANIAFLQFIGPSFGMCKDASKWKKI
jgi:hypothetical protein